VRPPLPSALRKKEFLLLTRRRSIPPRCSLPRSRLQAVWLLDGETLDQRSLRANRNRRIRVVDGEFLISLTVHSSSTQSLPPFSSDLDHSGCFAQIEADSNTLLELSG